MTSVVKSDASVPRHVAIIMDGNGRWAKERGRDRSFGHQNGRKPVRESVEAAIELGIEYLTLYTFSTENWKRPKTEVKLLWSLLTTTLDEEIEELIAQGVRLNVIGDRTALPSQLDVHLGRALEASRECKRLVLTLALNYGSRQEILRACSMLMAKSAVGELSPAELTPERFEECLYTASVPDPELVLRTSGEQRLSNFLLWQVAYAELLFLPIYWPDFRKEHFYQAIELYKQRIRRFGGV